MENFQYNPDGTKRYISRNNTPSSLSRTNGSRDLIFEYSNHNQSSRSKNQKINHSKLEHENSRTHLPPWSSKIDRNFFGKHSKAIQKFSPEYYEFQEFYKKFLEHKKETTKSYKLPYKYEESLIKESLAHFETFKKRKISADKAIVRDQRNSLPIYEFKHEIIQTVKNNRVTIISADTGAGKSTQVPQFLLESGFKNIACTQPRRIACVSLAKRVSYETMNIYGSEIAFKIRFEGNVTKRTKCLFLTEGILLRQLSSDKTLAQYDCIVVDEIHERHAQADFLLGILKKIISVNPDLKLVLMSATINSEMFSRYFDGAPLIEVPGRMFPVDINYVPIGDPDKNLLDPVYLKQRQQAEFAKSLPTKPMALEAKPFIRIMEDIDSKYLPTEPGDLLIFLSGMNEISAISRQIEEYTETNGRWVVLKLHSSLSLEEQDLAFDTAPEGVRKCILSTNIAETSVTIDGIRFVIDSGRVKEMEYDLSANLSKLSECWISKASAKQRSGRAGRTGPGICYRFYCEEEYDAFNDFSVPEIMRGSLEQIVLQMKALEVGDPRSFDFIEKPTPENVEHSMKLLKNIGALDGKENLTLVGYTLSMLPIDVVLGKMLILGTVYNLLELVIIIAASLSVQSPLLNLNDLRSEVTRNRKILDSPHGDPFTLLNVYMEWIKIKAESKKSSRRWCDEFGIQEQRLYEMSKLVTQFKSILSSQLGVEFDNVRRSKDSVKFALLQKRKHQESCSFREKKVLKIDRKSSRREVEYALSDVLQGQNDDNYEDVDEQEESLHDIELDYRVDIQEHHRKISALRLDKLSLPKLTTLKLIVCSGLYPNIAIPDPGNSGRRLQDQVFHSQQKRFLLLHPSSVFATNPNFIDAKKNSKSAISGPSSINLLADAEEGNLDISATDAIFDHSFQKLNPAETPRSLQLNAMTPEFLCFLQILETRKPYLMNLLRVPAFQTAFLFGNQIDCNKDLTKFVVDDWIIIQLKDKNRYSYKESKSLESQPNIAMLKLLEIVFELREIWNKLVSQRLRKTQANGFRYSSGLPQIDDSSHLDPNMCPKEILDSIPELLRSVYLSSRQSAPFVAQNEISYTRFSALLERFLSADVLLDGYQVEYSIDTVREDDYKVIFPDISSFNSSYQRAMAISSISSRQKLGIRITTYFNYGTIHYPKSLFESIVPIKNTAKSIKYKRPIVLGSRGNTRIVWECPKCKYASMLTQDEIKEHQEAKCPKLESQ